MSIGLCQAIPVVNGVLADRCGVLRLAAKMDDVPPPVKDQKPALELLSKKPVERSVFDTDDKIDAMFIEDKLPVRLTVRIPRRQFGILVFLDKGGEIVPAALRVELAPGSALMVGPQWKFAGTVNGFGLFGVPATPQIEAVVGIDFHVFGRETVDQVSRELVVVKHWA